MSMCSRRNSDFVFRWFLHQWERLHSNRTISAMEESSEEEEDTEDEVEFEDDLDYLRSGF